MRVDFTLRMDDVVALFEYHAAHHTEVRMQRLNGAIRVPRAIAMLGFGMAISGVPILAIPSKLLPVMPVLMIHALYHGWYWRHAPRRMAEKTHGIRALDGKLGKHQITLEPEAITSYGDLGVLVRRWDAVEEIVVTDEHAFFYVLEAGAIILPKRAFGDPDAFGEFVESAHRLLNAARE